MNISFNWLNELIETGMNAGETARQLTRVGLAVEGVREHKDDLVLDIDLTSNRPDCLSHLGVARELRAATRRPIEISSSKERPEVPMPPVLARDIVRIEDPDLCYRFTARLINNVLVGPSPQWLVDRLEAIGERSINNIADITNYVMHELGQPMHAFDLDKLAENRIVVRRARSGETITTLDGVDRELDGNMLAICDAVEPIAIGGVMGGLGTSITDETTNVLLEVAYFDRASIRATSRRLNLATEASYRFERGVDIGNLIGASNRATEMICEFAGGQKGDLIDIYPTKISQNQIGSIDISSAVKRLTGLDVQPDRCDQILDDLGITAKREATAPTYTAPTWRHDLAIEEDLVEEVARHAGYENIAHELPPAFGAGEHQATEHREKLLRQALTGLGFDEAQSYTFIDTKFDNIFQPVPALIDQGVEDKFVTLQDSVIEGAVRMRASLLPGLLDAVRLNLNHQRRDLKLFELGKVFAARPGEDGLPNEQEAFALVITGGDILDGRALPARDLDFYDAKGAVEAALEALDVTLKFEPEDVDHLRPGQSAALQLAGRTIGYLGRLNDEIATSYKFRQSVYLAELNLQLVLNAFSRPATYRPLAKYPAVVRDISLLSKRSVPFAQIRETVLKQGFDLIETVAFVDIYEGKGMAEDERSLTIRITYRSAERTLLEDEVEPVHQQILDVLERALDIRPRI
ncbi:MAG TPA: phenylalanine--tRNA ligase subunit beta [Pyrinomonadaceae bacterium]|nr:phenylalanine--tRNA ligase subunit beta [Pyrinomonadaceae bacterium]